jgi:oxygen-independent coproporphyrinogen-3 oxidase
VRVRHPAAYLAAVFPQERVAEVRTVPASDLPFEFTLNALRLLAGFTERQFEERTGLPGAALHGPIQQAEARGLLERRDDRWQPTARGRQFLNDLQGLFLPI